MSLRPRQGAWSRRARPLLAASLLAAVGGCASGSSIGGAASTTNSTATKPVGAAASLVVPALEPDGSFPSVAAPDRDGSLRGVRTKLVAVAKVDAPMDLVARPRHPDELFIAERAGRILLARRRSGAAKLAVTSRPLLDLSRIVGTEVEEGMLGLAFDRTGGVLYVSYNLRNGDSKVDAVTVTDVGGTPRLGTRRNVLTVDQPDFPNHKGGDLQLGPDGFLYFGLGDGGDEGDPHDLAQQPTTLLGKMLRIDPAHPTADRGYAIPPDNPYAHGGAGEPETWLTGLRNPWRFAFDPANGDLWIGDVGQSELEEIDRLPAGATGGANLGWSGYEGTSVFRKGRATGATVPPIFEVAHSSGVCAITGGVVYRGTAIAGLQGAYLFSDLCRPGVHALTPTRPADRVGTVTDERLLTGTGKAEQVISFGTDADGEVYLLSLDGSITRLEPAS